MKTTAKEHVRRKRLSIAMKESWARRRQNGQIIEAIAEAPVTTVTSDPDDREHPYRLIAGICNEKGITAFTLGQIEDLTTLCVEFAKQSSALHSGDCPLSTPPECDCKPMHGIGSL